MDALLRRLHAIGEPHPVLRAWQIETVHQAQIRAPHRTGFLQRNIVPGAISATSAQVLDRAPYAPPVEFGAKPHIIRPKNAKVLAWGGPRRLSGRLRKGAKAEFFATIVHHPGNKPQPHLLPGAKAALAKINDAIVKLWNSAA